jgi:stage II sporulation protein R
LPRENVQKNSFLDYFPFASLRFQLSVHNEDRKGLVANMKLKMKSLGIAYILILVIGTIGSLYIPKNEVTASESVVIPNEAIRLRILANSDLDPDQALKRLVRDEVNANITTWVQELTNINDARDLLQSKQPEIQAIAEAVVKREGSTQSVNVEFGKVQFPTKLYGQFLYPAGEYEAILITLGEGKGANWWCVLFPPLCFLDFSNGLAVSDGFEEERVVEPAAIEATTEVDSTLPIVEETPTPQKEVTDKEPVEVEKTEETVAKEKVINEPTPVTETIVETQAKQEPVYVAEAEEKVEVRFFLKEMWLKLF